MTSKQYSPIRIANPGEGHIVPLLPNQGFIVVLDGTDSSVDYDSPYFNLTKTIQHENYTTFVFEQNFDLSVWSRLSKVYLGEIIVMHSGNNELHSVGSLCVILNSSSETKKSLITTINPKIDVIKTELFDIIEVVLYDEKIIGDWNHHIIEGQNGHSYKLINSKVLYNDITFSWSDADNICFAYPRSILEKGRFVQEYHFWFQCTPFTMASLAKVPHGVYDGGRIILRCGSVFRSIELKINVKNKKIFNEKKLLANIEVPNTGIITKKQFDSISFYPQCRNQLLIHKIFLKEKDDCELNGDTVIIF